MLLFIGGVLAGSFVTFFVMSLLYAAKSGDQRVAEFEESEKKD